MGEGRRLFKEAGGRKTEKWEENIGVVRGTGGSGAVGKNEEFHELGDGDRCGRSGNGKRS